MILRKIKSALNYFKVFKSVKDVTQFRKLFGNNKTDNNLVSLRVKETNNHELFCRPNTTDYKVLWDTFFDKYHLPQTPIKKNAVILDLGANVGYTMVHFAYLYPEAKIYGVEMDKENFLLAKKNLSSLGTRCKIIQAAVWSEDGQITYNDDGDGEWGFRVTVDKLNEDHKLTSPAKTLSSIFKEFGLKEIDYLKMDIEGAEQNVLKNPDSWIWDVKAIKIEVHAPFTIEECLSILNNFGFNSKRDSKHPFAVVGIRNSTFN